MRLPSITEVMRAVSGGTPIVIVRLHSSARGIERRAAAERYGFCVVGSAGAAGEGFVVVVMPGKAEAVGIGSSGPFAPVAPGVGVG